jgi:gliding motility-associated-like protein
VEYWVYRRNGTYGFVPGQCELGVPSYTGYEFLASVSGVQTNQYFDSDVNFGANYCYMVVMRWLDGSMSYASDEVCAQLEKRVPILTQASVIQTGFADGSDSITWSPPISEILNQYTGPFHYELLHGNAGAAINDVIYVGPSNVDLFSLDTAYFHTDINTSGISHQYRIALYSDTVLVGTSSAAMTPWLSITPLDNAISLMVVEEVPWDNVRYLYYRKGPLDADFLLWKDTTVNHLIDDNLLNNKPYCYKVLTIGTYGTTGVKDPLYNWSQEMCASPYDQSPPCPPVIKVEPDCTLPQLRIHWNRPTCADDITGYRLYYTPTFGGPMQELATFTNPTDTVFILNEDLSSNTIAGCYGVVALDSLNLWPDGIYHQNESALSDTMCVDNCPVYSLPNLYTPNSDGKNDLYIPFPYRSIDHVELKIFNRWGTQVFESTDPAILWDGTDQASGQMCGDGVYYYTISVFEIRLEGITPRALSGYIHIVDGAPTKPKQ